MIYFLHPWRLVAVVAWLVFLVALMRRQKESLDWLDANVAPRFRRSFSRYTRASLNRHFVFLATTGALVILAAAGPFRLASVEREIENHTVLLALDASLSMGAQDAGVDPTTGEAFVSRFHAARSLARELVEELPRDTAFGVYSFSGTTVVHTPPTRDRASVSLLLDTLTYHVDLTRSGTRYSSLFEAFWSTIDPVLTGGYQVVLFSDGELPNADDYDDDLSLFSELGIPIHTVGVGTIEGQARVIYHPDDIRDAKAEKRIAREYHTTRVDETLAAIAEQTGGYWQVLEDQSSSETLVAAIKSSEASVARLEARGREDLSKRALALFVFCFLFETLVSSRRRPDSAASGSVAAIALIVFLGGCEPRIWKAHRTNETGIELLEGGEPGRSEAWFKKSHSLGYREHVPLFNLASAALERGDPAAAHEVYERTILAKPNMAEAYFNDGHALFLWAETEVVAGAEACEFERALELMQHAVSRFETTIEVENRWETYAAPAARNRDFLRGRMEEIRELAAECEAPPPPPSGGAGEAGGGEAEGGGEEGEAGGDGEQKDTGGQGPQQPEEPSSETPPSSQSPPLSDDERAAIRAASWRIRQEAKTAGGFRQSREQQLSPEMLENASGKELWW